jgi:hypothetical protein
VADETRESSDQRADAPRPRQPNRAGDPNNEWLIDQMGEDHNVSGSSTYRTLPPQPGKSARDHSGRDDQDARKRQSNR